MIRFILRRLLFAVLVLVAVSFLSFVLVYLSGDPVRSMAGLDSNEEHLARIRKIYGLDRPLAQQYFFFVRRALQGDLGWSFRYRMEVLPLVMKKFGVTMQLAAVSLLFSIIVAIPLGILSAIRRDTLADNLAMLFSLAGVSTPGFWLGIILILIFADQFRLLPSSGHEGLQSFILPALTLSGYSIGMMTRLMRRSMLEEMKKGYVVTAHAKGLAEWAVYTRHALRNALIPTVTVAGLQFGDMLGGSIVVETVFAWPGVGFLLIQAFQTNDLPVIRAVVLVVGSAFVFINLLVDILYTFLDPRIRYT